MRFWRWVPFAANAVGMAAMLSSIVPLVQAAKGDSGQPIAVTVAVSAGFIAGLALQALALNLMRQARIERGEGADHGRKLIARTDPALQQVRKTP
jgi:hypothetical protein